MGVFPALVIVALFVNDDSWTLTTAIETRYRLAWGQRGNYVLG